MTDELTRARTALNALTPDELAAIRDAASKLLDYYQTTGGLLTGGCWLEVKEIKYRPRPTIDDDGNISIPPKDDWPTEKYCYVRRAQVKANGRVTTLSVGYYGKAGVEVKDAKRGAELLAAHIAGGEEAGDAWLAAHGYKPPKRHERNKPPAQRPEHPLQDEQISSAALQESPVFQYFQASCPVPAGELLKSVRQFEHDLARYEAGTGLQFKTSLGELEQRRAAAKRKADTEKRRVRRRKR